MNTPNRLSRTLVILRIRLFSWLLGTPRKNYLLELAISELARNKRAIEAESQERQGWVDELTRENTELKQTIDGLQGNIEIIEGQIELYARWEQRESARLDAETARHTSEALPQLPRQEEYFR